MADAIDIAAQQFVERNPEVFGNVLLGGRQFNPKMDFSKGLMTKKLYNELTGLVSRFSRDSISPEDQKKLDKYFPNLTKEQIIGDSIASKKAFADLKPPTESTEKAESPSTPPVSTAQPSEPTGSTGQQGTAGTGSGSMGSTGGGIRGVTRKQFRGMTPEQRRALIARDDEVAANVSKGMSGDVKSQLTLPQTKKTALERARETLAGDTYQLGSSSILTAAREMRKPTPFRQRTDEQVAARNLVVRDRMAREQGKTYNPKATALDKAKSRMRDLATSQKGAQQFFADTGVSPRGVRAMSGERMPERRRTYGAPRNPNVVRTETPSERFEGRTNVSYRSFSPAEVNELEKRRRRNR
tara:strand:- start:1749 stop:2813 length:1065 start_codon:yes stop_codon:yes gene_type:complete